MRPQKAPRDLIRDLGLPRVPAELVFGRVAVKMLGAGLMPDADHGTLEQSEEAFGGVVMDAERAGTGAVRPGVFALGMRDAVVAFHLAADPAVDRKPIGDEDGPALGPGPERRVDGGSRSRGHGQGAGL